MLLSLHAGTYSLRCHDCWAINTFRCANVRICPYEVRRCLTVSIRKYLFLCLTPGELVTPPEQFQGAGPICFFSAPALGPWPALFPILRHVPRC